MKRSFLAKFLCPASNNSHIWATKLYKLTTKMGYLGNIYEIIGLSWTTKRSTPKSADSQVSLPPISKGRCQKKVSLPVSQTLHLRPKPRGKRSELRLEGTNASRWKETSYNPQKLLHPRKPTCHTFKWRHLLKPEIHVKKHPSFLVSIYVEFFWGYISPLKLGRFSQTGLEKS